MSDPVGMNLNATVEEEIHAKLIEMGQDPDHISENFIFNLHSKPKSTLSLLLDFNGHTTTKTVWSNRKLGGNYPGTIKSAPYNLDGKSGFSNDELTSIFHVWLLVSEDFMPFNIDVTTKELNKSALQKTSSSDASFGMRCVIDSDGAWAKIPAGGLSLPSGKKIGAAGMFGDKAMAPCFVFPKQLSNVPGKLEQKIAITASHEVGHTLGLGHDGKKGAAIYSGTSNWGAIMGAPYERGFTQWNNGSYGKATNKEDDLKIISKCFSVNGHNGYEKDDVGNSADTAHPLVLKTSGKLFNGIITSRNDVDFFSVKLDGGNYTLTIKGMNGITNLDVLVKLYDSNKKLVKTYDPTNTLGVTFSTQGLKGTYYFSVEGTGRGTTYPKYGSLGAYTISVKKETNKKITAISGEKSQIGEDTHATLAMVMENEPALNMYSSTLPCTATPAFWTLILMILVGYILYSVMDLSGKLDS